MRVLEKDIKRAKQKHQIELNTSALLFFNWLKYSRHFIIKTRIICQMRRGQSLHIFKAFFVSSFSFYLELNSKTCSKPPPHWSQLQWMGSGRSQQTPPSPTSPFSKFQPQGGVTGAWWRWPAVEMHLHCQDSLLLIWVCSRQIHNRLWEDCCFTKN